MLFKAAVFQKVNIMDIIMVKNYRQCAEAVSIEKY